MAEFFVRVARPLQQARFENLQVSPSSSDGCIDTIKYIASNGNSEAHPSAIRGSIFEVVTSIVMTGAALGAIGALVRAILKHMA